MKGDIIVLEEHHKQAARKIVPEITDKIKSKSEKTVVISSSLFSGANLQVIRYCR